MDGAVDVAALKKIEQRLESHRIEWQEDESSLLQAIEGRQKTLQHNEQESEEKESSMKKKKNWYRKLF